MESGRMVVDLFVWLVLVNDHELKAQKPTLYSPNIREKVLKRVSIFSKATWFLKKEIMGAIFLQKKTKTRQNSFRLAVLLHQHINSLGDFAMACVPFHCPLGHHPIQPH